MSIDTGLGITYRENYPVPGINQSSQQFRDNFKVTRYALENIHAARTSSSSILDLSFTVNETNGQVQFNLGYVDPNALPQNLIDRIVHSIPGMMADDFDEANIARAASFMSVVMDPEWDADCPF